jgi:predicted negative regulator of RcsB-dependent stress response
MAEPERDTGDLRKEIIEARNLVIKTDNQLKNVHADLKLLAKRQEEMHRRQWLASGVAYLLFVGLCVGGGMVLSSARVSSVKAEAERAEKQRAEATAQFEKLKADAQAVALAEREAAEAYRLMTTLSGDDRAKGLDALVKVDTNRLSVLERQALLDRAEVLRKEIGQASLDRARAAFKRHEMSTVSTELPRFLAMNPPADEGLEAAFMLGVAQVQTKHPDVAIPHLEKFLAEEKRSKGKDLAMLNLAQAYEQTGQLDKAVQTAREALSQYSGSELAPQMRPRLASAKRALNEAADAGTSAPAAAPAATPAPGAR